MKRVNRKVARKNIKVEKIDRRRTCDKNVCGGCIIEDCANIDLEDKSLRVSVCLIEFNDGNREKLLLHAWKQWICISFNQFQKNISKFKMSLEIWNPFFHYIKNNLSYSSNNIKINENYGSNVRVTSDFRVKIHIKIKHKDVIRK